MISNRLPAEKVQSQQSEIIIIIIDMRSLDHSID